MHPALSKDAQTFLESLPAKPFQQITLTLFRLMEHPQPHDSKPLVGAAYARVDSGEYRVIYAWTPATVRIALIGKRNDDNVYRRVKRR